VRLIRTTYAMTTPESASAGDHSETGWHDEAGEPMDPDKWDDEGTTAVDKAVAFLEREGATEPSGSTWYPHLWYSWPDASTVDWATGEDEMRSYHLDGFTEEEERAILARVTG
jgi:hypothetical protein